MGRKLNTYLMDAEGVIHEPGTDESKIKGEVTAEGVWNDASGGDDSGYGAMKVADLKVEIERRNEGREEADLISDEGVKADLIAALELDDEA